MKRNFIKVGRIYWIKPMALPNFNSKERPAIALLKYDKGKTIFIQIGTTNSKIPSSIKATTLFKQVSSIKVTKLFNSNTHLDISKPEWNTSIKKPYLHKGKYVDCNYKIISKIRKIYFSRRSELRVIRIRKAKIAAISDKCNDAKKQLQMLKNMEPIKYKNINVEKLVSKFKKI